MKFLSLWQPWLWAILDPRARKWVENRDWMPKIEMIDQRIALHAAKTFDVDAVSLFLEYGIDWFPARKDMYPTGAILGVATIDRIVTDKRRLPEDQQRWFFGEYGWLLRDVIALPEPVPCRGERGLRVLPPDVERAVNDQLARPRAPEQEAR